MSIFKENLTYESVLEEAQLFLGTLFWFNNIRIVLDFQFFIKYLFPFKNSVISDALLADLQNTVPGQNNTLPSSIKAHNLSNSSGYGSLNGVKKQVQSVSIR